jgi:tetratricopeptide (TPR) repeat protein
MRAMGAPKYYFIHVCMSECQKLAWRAGHKHECVPACAPAAAAARAGSQTGGQVTDKDMHVLRQIMERYERQDFGGVLAIEDKVRMVATRAPPEAACFIYASLGNCYYRLGQYGKAIELHKEHKKIAEEVGDRAGVGKACGNLGNCYCSMGQYGKAMGLHQEEKKIAEEVGDRAGVGKACGNLGCCYCSMGQYNKAIELHKEHKKIAEEVGDRAGLGQAGGNLG